MKIPDIEFILLSYTTLIVTFIYFLFICPWLWLLKIYLIN